MKQIFFLIIWIVFSFISQISFAEQKLPALFLYFEDDSKLALYQKILEDPCIKGVQIRYSWKELEPQKEVYDFSKIKKDLHFLTSLHKKLFIQLQDRSFQPKVFYVPDYIRQDQDYHGGVAMQYDFPGEGRPISTGWVAKVWEPEVRKRFQLLIKKLAIEFDGKIEGINLPETAVDFDPKKLPQGFTNDQYFSAELDNLGALRATFTKSTVIQYVNFFPGEWNNDHHYMSRLFSYAAEKQIGLGGPDVAPYRKSQMKNSYAFFHQYQGKINPIGMAIQEGDYTYRSPKNHQPYRFLDFYLFARDYLGATILFWNIQEPFFSKELIPNLKTQYFQCGNKT